MRERGTCPPNEGAFWRKWVRVAKPGMQKWLTGRWHRIAISCTGFVRLFPGLKPGGKLHPNRVSPCRLEVRINPSDLATKECDVGSVEAPRGPTQLREQPGRRCGGRGVGGGRMNPNCFDKTNATVQL